MPEIVYVRLSSVMFCFVKFYILYFRKGNIKMIQRNKNNYFLITNIEGNFTRIDYFLSKIKRWYCTKFLPKYLIPKPDIRQITFIIRNSPGSSLIMNRYI